MFCALYLLRKHFSSLLIADIQRQLQCFLGHLCKALRSMEEARSFPDGIGRPLRLLGREWEMVPVSFELYFTLYFWVLVLRHYWHVRLHKTETVVPRKDWWRALFHLTTADVLIPKPEPISLGTWKKNGLFQHVSDFNLPFLPFLSHVLGAAMSVFSRRSQLDGFDTRW